MPFFSNKKSTTELVIALLNYPLTFTDMWTEMAEEKAKLVLFPSKRRQTIDFSEAINMWNLYKARIDLLSCSTGFNWK